MLVVSFSSSLEDLFYAWFALACVLYCCRSRKKMLRNPLVSPRRHNVTFVFLFRATANQTDKHNRKTFHSFHCAYLFLSVCLCVLSSAVLSKATSCEMSNALLFFLLLTLISSFGLYSESVVSSLNVFLPTGWDTLVPSANGCCDKLIFTCEHHV